MKLKDKVAIITGGAGEIGKVTAKLFLEEGANVVLVDLFQESLDRVKEELSDLGQVHTIQADVTEEEDVENYVNQTVEKYGKIDIFFNNAGIEGKVAPIIEQSIETLDQVLAVNVRGVFLGLKHVLRVMGQQEYGSVINTSSAAGLHGSPNISPYITSKHAVVGLTKAAAVEMARKNVRINSIHPSPVDSPMMQSLEAGLQTKQESVAKTIPLGRYAQSTDVAKVVLFLASDDSDFITGSQYRVDGGMGAK